MRTVVNFFSTKKVDIFRRNSGPRRRRRRKWFRQRTSSSCRSGNKNGRNQIVLNGEFRLKMSYEEDWHLSIGANDRSNAIWRIQRCQIEQKWKIHFQRNFSMTDGLTVRAIFWHKNRWIIEGTISSVECGMRSIFCRQFLHLEPIIIIWTNTWLPFRENSDRWKINGKHRQCGVNVLNKQFKFQTKSGTNNVCSLS